MKSNAIAFDGEATIPFRVYARGMSNLLFAFCVMGKGVYEWVGDTVVPGSEKEHYWEDVAVGKIMTIVDKNTGCTNCLDSEKLMQGIRRWIEKGEGTFTDGKIVLGLNPFIADRIVQYALFEEVRYE